MNYKARIWIVIILLVLAIILSFPFPREAKYKGTDFISKLDIPSNLSGWIGRDVTANLNINTANDIYNFINDALAYEYVNKEGERLFFIILDAANFHHPNICFTSAGFKIKELADTELNISNRRFKTHTLYTKKELESFLSLYWIVIDKKIVHEWIEQKLKQLYFSMFNKKRVGLMVRIDIPAQEKDIEKAKAMAQNFLIALEQTLSSEQADYIFGKAR